MKLEHRPRAWMALVCLLATGCTSLREIPRSDYAAEPERKHVRLVTREGLTYEFDYVEVNGDSLVGYRERDVEGPVEEYGSLKVSLAEIQKLSARSVDWYRTGIIGGGVVAALVAKGLTGSNDTPSETGSTSGGPGGRVP